MHAVIFDMDGVLVDSEDLSCGAWLPVLRRRGLELQLADIQVFIGQADRAILQHYRQVTGLDLGNELIAEKEREFFAAAEISLTAFPGLREILEQLGERGVPLAVASSSRHGRIQFSLRKAGLEAFFPVVCSADDVRAGKPAPDLFLLAARSLGVEPEGCAVIEDSLPGITAACAAGMRALGFTSSHAAAALREVGADATFERYSELMPLLYS